MELETRVESSESGASALLIDGNSVFYPTWYVADKQGRSMDAPRKFLERILQLGEKRKPDYFAVAFDPPCSGTWRKKICPDYKAHRVAAPELLREQKQLAERLCQENGLHIEKVDDYEADDVLATWCGMAEQQSARVEIVSEDKDLLQLVKPNVNVLHLERHRTLGESEVHQHLGVWPSQVIDFFSLVGDSADNVPGIRGIGPKSAADLLRKFGTLEGVLAAAEDGSILSVGGIGKVRRRAIVEHAEDALFAKRLITLRPVEDIKIKGIHRLLRKMGS